MTSVPLLNANLRTETEDNLYHFGLARSKMNFVKEFSDVKFVCCGGSGPRLKLYAERFAGDISVQTSENISRSDRFVLYKTGPVLWVNHGMGNPSIGIMLVEMIKLLHYAKAENVTFFRMGTSGGLGVAPGTVLISSAAVNGELEEAHTQYIMGKKVSRPTKLDDDLRMELKKLATELNIPAECGKTFCADDFYEGQARLDGEFCEYTKEDKMNFIKSLYEKGVRNIEMESTCFSSLTNRAGIKAGIVCVALLNRLEGDQINLDKDQYLEFETRPFKLITSYIKRRMNN